jgi:hypothetical protein
MRILSQFIKSLVNIKIISAGGQMKIISEKEVTIRGKKYKEIISENGQVILRQYNPKYKMWVNLKFSQEDDTEIIHNLKNMVTEVLFSA